LVELLHIIKAVHVAAGFTFAATAVFHILKNWKTLKSCFKSV
jgi:hypothetical protein